MVPRTGRQVQVSRPALWGPPRPRPPGTPRPSGAATLELAAKDIKYDKTELSAAAGQPFAIHFKNNDPAGVTHDVDIRQSDGKTVLQDKPTIDGGKETTYDYTALKAGSYVFICSIHPTLMSGTLTVK